MAMLSDRRLEKLERSKAYSIVDFLLNWIFEGIGALLLSAYAIHLYYYEEDQGFMLDWRLGFWKKAFLLGIALLFTKNAKDGLLSWMGIAPPDETWINEKLFRQPKQEPSVLGPEMGLIRFAQDRAERIRNRKIRVDQLLAENEAFYQRQLRRSVQPGEK